jgi:hypothetical protein
VAADERGVNATVYRLLKGFLVRSVWLYAILGLAAYMMSGAFWALRIGRIPLVGMWLGMWGSIAAFNTQSLVWRSLPIAFPDIALYRWWVAVAVPGCFLTVLIMSSWGVQLSARFPAPDGLEVLLDVLVNWAALALVAASWDEIRCSAGQSKVAAGARTLLLMAFGVTLTGYGLPIEADSLAGVWSFVCAGLILLVLAALRAQRATDKHWVYASSGGRLTSPWLFQGATRSRLFGLKALYVPALRYGLILAVLTSLGLVIANKLVSYDKFPHAATIFLILALVVHSMSSYVFVYRLRNAAHLLRCLPLSVNRLAGLLQVVIVVPGLIAAMGTLVTVRWVLHFNINMWVASSFALALVSVVGIVNQSQRLQAQQMYTGPFTRRWLPLIQSLLVPGWFGLTATALAVDTGVWSSSRFGLVGWVCLGLGIFFFALGHYALVRHLRAGIRPSANQTAFSVA